MPCSCSGTARYVVTLPDGSTVEKSTVIEAAALARRTGGTYTQK